MFNLIAIDMLKRELLPRHYQTLFTHRAINVVKQNQSTINLVVVAGQQAFFASN